MKALHRFFWAGLPVAFVLTACLPIPATAQDAKDRVVTIEVQDGRVLVNGKAVETVEGEGPVVIEVAPGAGDERIVVRRGGRNVVAPRAARFFGEPGTFSFDADALSGHMRDLERDLRVQLAPLRSGALTTWSVADAEEAREIARMETETRRLAAEARRAEGAERARLERELGEKLDALFTRKLATERKRLAQLEERADAQRERLAQRERSRRDLIERRQRELLGEEDWMDW